MNKKCLILIFCGALSACATNIAVKPNDPVIAPATQTVTIPAEYLKECDNLTEPEPRAYTQGDTVDLINTWRDQHSECMKNHKGLIDTVKKAFNISLAYVEQILS